MIFYHPNLNKKKKKTKTANKALRFLFPSLFSE